MAGDRFKHVIARLGSPSPDELALQALIDTASESSTLEAKGFSRIPKIDDEVLEDQIIAPVVSMLNSGFRQGGLVILGVKAHKGRLQALDPAAPGVLSTPKIRSWILDHIVSSPSGNPFRHDVLEVEKSHGTVFLIDVESESPQAVFASKDSHVVYLRRADSRESLTFPQAMALAEQRAAAQIELILGDPTTIQRRSGQPGVVTIDLIWRNLGNRPGKEVTTVFRVAQISGNVTAEIVGPNVQGQPRPGPMLYEAQASTSFADLPLYPGLVSNVAQLRLRFQTEFGVLLTARTFDQAAHSDQDFRIVLTGESSLRVDTMRSFWALYGHAP